MENKNTSVGDEDKSSSSPFANTRVLKEKLQRTLEDLENLERYLNCFSTSVPTPILVVSPTGIVAEINLAFEKLSGFKRKEIIGQPFEKFFLEKEKIETTLREPKEEFKEISELSLISKFKARIPVKVFIREEKSERGKTIGSFVALKDLRETQELKEGLERKVKERTQELEKTRKALMNMLEDTEESRKKTEEEKSKTLAIITNLTDGLLFFDRENNLILVNPQAEVFLEIKFNDFLGTSLEKLSRFSSLKPLIDILKGEIETALRKELQFRENLILEISILPMLKKEEKIGTLVILHDITREKMIERMKTEFVSISAHQLRTPLSAIKWTLKMLLDEDLGKITDEQRKYIERTYQSNERMIALIKDLLNVTKIEEGRYLYKLTYESIEKIVQSVIDSLKEDIKKKGLKIEFRKPESKLPKIKVDIEKITLVIQNLLDNAIRYTRTGGEVTISLEKINMEIGFKIKDSGVGIPRNQQSRVFAKFFRGSNVMRMDTEGTGLGLFITKNIIKAHRGRIWFESEEGRGSTFYFILPISQQ
ncbi:MAG: hypothetical protein COS47_00030 [Candidatus Nealsonbacteria bacterium CG03_land_8_20_14_0_80_36_12]|uniref:histidine kinase n=1 Tax=Candidatus Nealsonbacteria bacterium CG03_land_8_20_14_0_80_36_12 TaxID=1974701 RepID=A0A2M7BZ09_9BACT|nr:MAG: hypothetical protein COS47_00030 [Candidatus Nealsonbacteria bacterium CG03_land_8_20_14_0_80_36_12]